MSAFWNFVTRMVPGTLARAEDVNTNFDGVDNGFTLVEAEIDKSLQITNSPGVTDINLNAASRANKLISFDVNGDIAATTIIGDWKGDHADAAGTDYEIRDVVKDAAASIGQDNLYICNNTHTSTGSLATDVANWDLLVESSAAMNWAIKIDGIVSATDYSSKAYAIGGTGVTDTAGKGAAKEWATKAEDSTVDTVGYSALHWAAKTAADLVLTNADVVSTNADVTYAAEWANKAEDSLVSAAAGGDEVDDYSALHWANKAAVSAATSADLASAVAGTDTYTATLGIGSYTTGKTYYLSFANTNTIAVPTLNFDSLGAKTIKSLDGTALAIGEIPDEALIRYDGTDMILLNPASNITLGTPATLTNQTFVDFSIPPNTKKITVMFKAVSTNGTSEIILQLGDSGGIETAGYAGTISNLATATISTANIPSSGFQCSFSQSSGKLWSGSVILSLLDKSSNTWTIEGGFGREEATAGTTLRGAKALSAELDKIRFTTVGGTDQGDSGILNIQFE